jgi:hypothetical protein
MKKSYHSMKVPTELAKTTVAILSLGRGIAND